MFPNSCDGREGGNFASEIMTSNGTLIPGQDDGFNAEVGFETGLQVIFSSCAKQCLTCEDSATNCTSCVPALNRHTEAPSCLCIPGYHDNAGTTQDCEKCSDNCAEWY